MAVGRSGNSSGQGAPQPRSVSSRMKLTICSGSGMYPAKPPWCSLVMIPSNPPSSASFAWAQTSRTMLGASRSLWGYRRHEIDFAAKGAVVVISLVPSERGVAAAAHDKRLAGHVASLVAAEERGGRTDVGDRVTEATQRHQPR